MAIFPDAVTDENILEAERFSSASSLAETSISASSTDELAEVANMPRK